MTCETVLIKLWSHLPGFGAKRGRGGDGWTEARLGMGEVGSMGGKELTRRCSTKTHGGALCWAEGVW